MDSHVNADTLAKLMVRYQHDTDIIETIQSALESFETYHQSIYSLEIVMRLHSSGAMDADSYREQVSSMEQTRTLNHNRVLSELSMLNRLAEMAGLPSFYDGVISEERPYRTEAADAVLAFVRQVITQRHTGK